ncbi:methyltransferase [Thalassotalea sp. M1531]|uniref:Methyltransferase n=1 Tax=Thalassotalea algicola TaxID=2716224 RepID=A0A7Y0Q886_9GAMM|nr:class I SAM-dependent methyltransferase [Thalassotalea algicola]NMP31865.1 methyltransferase [Thalassotalea algicola]
MKELIQHINFNNLQEAQRLFHGRGHAYPGYEQICVDWLSPVVLITLYKEESSEHLAQLASLLNDNIPQSTSVQVQHRWQPRAPFELLLGEDVRQTHALESELKYHIELGNAQNTGLFLDMKNGRDWVRENAKQCNVLNLFSYTCAFSVAAIAGGAQQVVNIDLSKASLAKGRENHRLNQQATDKVIFQGVDIFKSFGRLKKFGPYQMVIVDPPSFQKGSVNIEKDYGKILRRLPEMVSDNAKVMLCLNNPDLTEQFLFDKVAEYCPQLEFVERIGTPKVYQEAQSGRGLKVLVFSYQ